MKIFYDIPYMKGIMTYVFVPVVIVVLLVGISLFVYSKKNKDHDDPHYNFVMDFWSSLIGIIITGTILAIAVGFSVAMTEKMQEYGLVEEKKMLYYLLKYFIVIPFIFVIWYIVKFLKTIYHKPKKKKAALEPLNNVTTNTEQAQVVDAPVEQSEVLPSSEVTPTPTLPLESPVLESEAVVPSLEEVDSTLPPIEETIQEEMKQFSTSPSVPAEEVEVLEEPEIISLEEEK